MKEMSKEYAIALFTLGKESGKEKLFETSLTHVLSVMTSHPEYQEFLACPGIPLEVRLAGIQETFREEVCEEVRSLVALLCRRGRLGILEACLSEYQALLRHFYKKTIVNVTSAVALTMAEQARLQAKLEAQSQQSVVLSCSVNSDLIGGIIVEMNGCVLDGSLKTQMEQVKEVVSQ